MFFSIPFFLLIPPAIFLFPLSCESTVSISWEEALFSGTIMSITTIVIIWNNYYMKEESDFKIVNFGIISFATSMLFLVLSGDPLMAIIGFDLLGATSFFLILYYKSWNAINGAMTTLLMNKVGDLGLILSVLNLIFPILLWSNPLSIFIFCLAVGVKAAQIPFNTWLPLAMEAPTPVSSLVHSSTLVTAGIFLMMKLHYENESMFWVSFLTLFLSSFLALLEKDTKKVVALSTMSQMSLIIISLSLGNKTFAFFHLITHALFKSLLFICVGNVIHSSAGNQTFSMSAKMNKTNSLLIFFCLLNLTGLAFSSGFFSKEMIISQTELLSSSPLIISFFLILLTFLYCCRLWAFFFSIFFSRQSPSVAIIIFSFFSLIFGQMFFQENQMTETPLSSHSISHLLLLSTLVVILTKSTTVLTKTNKMANKSTGLLKKTWKLNPSDTPLYFLIMKINNTLSFFSNFSSFLSTGWLLIIFSLLLFIF